MTVMSRLHSGSFNIRTEITKSVLKQMQSLSGCVQHKSQPVQDNLNWLISRERSEKWGRIFWMWCPRQHDSSGVKKNDGSCSSNKSRKWLWQCNWKMTLFSKQELWLFLNVILVVFFPPQWVAALRYCSLFFHFPRHGSCLSAYPLRGKVVVMEIYFLSIAIFMRQFPEEKLT